MLGTTLDNRYVIAGKLGSGGMARVYLAKDKDTGKKVAIKVLQVSPLLDNSSLKRFQREFDICSKLDNEHIVRLYTFGTTAERAPYIAMEYIDGETLGDYFDREGPFSEAECVKLLEPVVSALSAFHDHGVVHRDLKPDNIMITNKGRVVVMDFGLARDLGVTALTETGAILGTPYYMSPELAQGEGSDHRSDIWQIGVLAYEMMTGDKPFDGNDIGAVLAQIIFREAKEARLPKGIGGFIDQCLKKDKNERFGTAREALAALRNISKRRRKEAKEPRRNSARPARTTPIDPVAKNSLQEARPLLIALCLLLFILLFGLIRLKNNAKHGFDVKSLHITPTWQGFDVSWHSTDAYPSRVNVTSRQERTFQRLFSEDDEATRHHEVHISGLKESEKYELKVLFPDGTLSFPIERETKKLNWLISSTFEGPDKVKLVITTEPQCKVTLCLKSSEIKRLYEREKPSEPIIIPMTGKPIDGLSATVNTAQGSLGKDYDLASILVQRVQSLVTKLSHFSLDDTLRGLSVPHWTAPSHVLKTLTGKAAISTTRRIIDDRSQDSDFAKKCLFVGKTIDERFVATSLSQDFQEALALCPLVFNSKLIPFPLKMKFHQTLNPFIGAFVFSCLADCKSERLQIPHLGDCRLTIKEPHNMGWGIVLHETIGPKLYIGKPAPFRSTTYAKWRKSFTIESLEGAREAILAIHLRRIHRMAMKCRVNSLFNCYLYGQPVLYEGEDTETVLYQHIPTEALMVGRNTIELQHETFVGKGLETKASIKTLLLHFVKAQ